MKSKTSKGRKRREACESAGAAWEVVMWRRKMAQAALQLKLKSKAGHGFKLNFLTAQKFCHSLRPRPHLQFFVDAADVGVDGLVADAEFLRDLLVDQPPAQQVEHLLFALGQAFR